MVKPAEMPTDGQKLKELLHKRIESLDRSTLSLLNRVLLQLEAEELAQRLDEGFDEDEKTGRLTGKRVQSIISQVRGEYRY